MYPNLYHKFYFLRESIPTQSYTNFHYPVTALHCNYLFLCVSASSSEDKPYELFIYPQCLSDGGPSINAGESKLREKWTERLEQSSAEELEGWASGSRNKEEKEVTYRK